MTEDREGFPEPRDIKIQQDAEKLVNFADELTEWLGKHGGARSDTDFAISPADIFHLLRLRRNANSLYNSSRVPVAAAVYGASQTGKSLFMGRVLQPADASDSPLGISDQLQPDAYLRELSFDWDINPRSGSNEATALVTRFTTKDRFDREALPDFPVKVRALTRSEWMRVLARGFRSECTMLAQRWEDKQLAELFDQVSKTHAAELGNREWQMDLLDTYVYVRGLEPLRYHAEESTFNSYLSTRPLTDAGYIEIAASLFWDSGADLPDVRKRITRLFGEVEGLLKRVCNPVPNGPRRDGILLHWGAVRFLLDSQRQMCQENSNSRWRQRLEWSDFHEVVRDGWLVIDYKQGAGPPGIDLATLQSAMLEMILPVVPHRLNGEWREVVKKMDILDLPGLVAGGGDAQSRSNTAESLEQRMMIVKRGKVFYLIDRYIEERQIQTLLVLFRGGNPSVRQVLQECVNKWGKMRYGEHAWPRRISTNDAALFIGMTGIDEEIKDEPPQPNVYDARLNNIVEHTFRDVMTNFGGADQPFTNIYPIRYPGTWDTDETRREKYGKQNWTTAREVFLLKSEKVRIYIHEPERRWDVAMRDNDGGMSLICDGFIKCTNSLQKQETLEQHIREADQGLRNLARTWYQDPNANLDREKRFAMGDKVLLWLENEDYIYDRLRALETALCFDAGHATELSDFAEQRNTRTSRVESLEVRFSKRLKEFLHAWAVTVAPERWQKHVAKHDHGAPWLNSDDFGAFARYLGDYLCSDHVFAQLDQQLIKIIKLPVSDQGARRYVLREYVQLLLNDFVMNPGPDMSPLGAAVRTNGQKFGLMDSLIARWRSRLPHALASAAGEHRQLPEGNNELNTIISQYS